MVLPNALANDIGQLFFVKRLPENRTTGIRHGVERTRARHDSHSELHPPPKPNIVTISSSGSECAGPNQDEQRGQAHQPRDQEEDEGHRDLPGRQLGRHAGDGEAEAHSGARVGQEEVPGHVQAGGDVRGEGKGRGLEENGAENR